MSAVQAGIYIPKNPHIKLRNLYKKILHLMRKLPRDAAYKMYTEAIICHRLSIVNEAGDKIDEIEQNIWCGNISMLLRQAEEEYALLQNFFVWKPWEPLIEKPPHRQWTWPPY